MFANLIFLSCWRSSHDKVSKIILMYCNDQYCQSLNECNQRKLLGWPYLCIKQLRQPGHFLHERLLCCYCWCRRHGTICVRKRLRHLQNGRYQEDRWAWIRSSTFLCILFRFWWKKTHPFALQANPLFSFAPSSKMHHGLGALRGFLSWHCALQGLSTVASG